MFPDLLTRITEDPTKKGNTKHVPISEHKSIYSLSAVQQASFNPKVTKHKKETKRATSSQKPKQ